MTDARIYHTATLLSNGKVLVAGGAGGSGAISSAELYDPNTSTWSPTGSMIDARALDTATLLNNGKVLVAGGSGRGPDYLSSAELYDPNTGVWSATGSMETRREEFTATLLPDGKVLVAGGNPSSTTCCDPTASAELYDPNTGKWAPTGSMNVARCCQKAVLLPDGKVLVTGGLGAGVPGVPGWTPLSSAELYDPSSGTWSLTGNMAAARYDHTATLLPDGQVLVAGGANRSGVISSSELYDPESGTWSLVGSLTVVRVWHTATLLPDGQILVIGGQGGQDGSTVLSSSELYGPALCDSNCGVNSGTATPELDSGELLAMGLLPIGAALLYRRARRHVQ